jgi:hypothetical protein
LVNLEELAKPFPIEDIEFRCGTSSEQKQSALALAYLTSRSIMDRLDQVVGPMNWKDEYKPGVSGGLLCGISIWDNEKGEWVTKWDGAENTQFEAVKGGLSDALKRTAVKWGIGRYLYRLPAIWVDATVKGKKAYFKNEDQVRAKFAPYLQPHLQFPGDKLDARGKKILRDKITELGYVPETKITQVFGDDCTIDHMTKVSARNLITFLEQIKDTNEVSVELEQKIYKMSMKGEYFE